MELNTCLRAVKKVRSAWRHARSMRTPRALPMLLCALGGAFMAMPSWASATVTEYAGTCDASAAIVLGDRQFVVANDEDNVLRVYREGQTAAPVSTLDLSKFLKSDPKHPEADLEAAARIGNRIYWITSHGANSDGDLRSGRRRLFVTQINGTGEAIKLTAVGKPYRKLVRDLTRSPTLKAYKLGDAAKIAPKEPGGLNIEGLAATPDGRLLIGLRGPIPDGKALLIPLNNPQAVVAGQSARLGEPILLELGGRGVRSIEYVPTLGQYLIVAGAAGIGGEFQLYRWSGAAGDEPVAVNGENFSGLQPEAMIAYPGPPVRLLVFSDDGTREAGSVMCKDLPVGQRRFRTLWVTP
jgi:hypothetical protein